jgi:hypothetical protein
VYPRLCTCVLCVPSLGVVLFVSRLGVMCSKARCRVHLGWVSCVYLGFGVMCS